MVAEGVLALGIVLAVLMAILHMRRISGSVGDDREDARDLVRQQIDAHVEALARQYLEARSHGGACRPGTDAFGQAVELFIGDLLRRAERSEPWLKEALREIVVLQRDDVYSEILARVEAHLRRPSAAG